MDIHKIFNPKYLSESAIVQLKQDYETAQPYRHILLDNFLQDDLANTLYENFPSIDLLNVKRKSLNEDKSEDYHFERFHPAFTQLREAIASKEFCEILGKITGIEGLHTTQDALGSGVHQGKNGSFVDVHVDVNMNTNAGLWRRLNLLIYLNKNWQPNYGGELEIWDRGMTKCWNKVLPAFNRAILFYTDENSPHGVAKLTVPENESRKSFYTYYYTQPEAGVSYRDSKFISRPDDTFGKKLATGTKEAIKIRAKQFLKALGIRSLDFQDKNK